MLFHSLPFAVFLPVVFMAYWALHGRRRAQNLLLLAASYVFYGWWDWRFLGLLAASSLGDYWLGGRIADTHEARGRRRLLTLSLGANLGFLGIFKYYGFFASSLHAALRGIGIEASLPVLDVVLPVGISFYTFQSLSYTIDVWRGDIKASRDPVAFLAFVSFFPQLVAGPIERAAWLLPQFERDRVFDDARARDGLREMLWGFVKKLLVADNLAPAVDRVFSHWGSQPSPALAAGAFLFGVQIYCDFSGYSHIARGTARLLGFELSRNFLAPYFSAEPGEFWRRWHVSLSSWFRDYLYVPLGGGRCAPARRLVNVMVTFLASGLWHGANWTFVAWGLVHGLMYVPFVVFPTLGARVRSGPGRVLGVLATFTLTTLAWVFFRAPSLSDATGYLLRLVTAGGWLAGPGSLLATPCALGLALLAIEWLRQGREHPLEVSAWPVVARWFLYYLLVGSLLLWGSIDHVAFIYFQF